MPDGLKWGGSGKPEPQTLSEFRAYMPTRLKLRSDLGTCPRYLSFSSKSPLFQVIFLEQAIQWAPRRPSGGRDLIAFWPDEDSGWSLPLACSSAPCSSQTVLKGILTTGQKISRPSRDSEKSHRIYQRTGVLRVHLLLFKKKMPWGSAEIKTFIVLSFLASHATLL